MQTAKNTAPQPAAVESNVTPKANTQEVAAPKATGDDQPPVSKLPPLEEIRAAKVHNVAKEKAAKDAKDALAYANGLIEEASGNRGATHTKSAPKNTPNTSVSTPDTATMELTQKQADELSQQKDVTVATLAKEADRMAKQNKILQDGDEVTISFH